MDMSEWINVEDRLPVDLPDKAPNIQCGKTIIVAHGPFVYPAVFYWVKREGSWFPDFYKSDGGVIFGDDIEITHWMSLPARPEEGDNE